MTCAYLEVNVIRQEEKPGLCPRTRAEAEDFGYMLSAERRVRHDHVVFRDRSILDHLGHRQSPAHITTSSNRRQQTQHKHEGTKVAAMPYEIRSTSVYSSSFHAE